jgi:hypothetical protein
MKLRLILISTTALLALSACGSSSNEGDVKDANDVYVAPDLNAATRIFSSGNGDAGDVLADGGTLTARQGTTSGITLDYDDERGGGTGLVENPQLAIAFNDDGELTLFVEGQEQAFSSDDYEVEDDGTVYGYFTQEQCDTIGVCNSLFSWSGTLDEFKDSGNGYHKVYVLQTNQLYGDDEALSLSAYGVAGTETRDDALGSLGSATYEGFSRIDAYPVAGFVDNGTSRTRIDSDVTMSVDFGSGTLSGFLSNTELRRPDEDDGTLVAGTIVMEESRFAGNGFMGGLQADADWVAATGSTLSGNYSGAFFGPNAEEAAGTISATGTFDGQGDVNAIGFFGVYAD